MTTECNFPQISSQFDNIPDNCPVVFISYSWDSEAHKQWVSKLSYDLRKKYGVYTLLDQYCLPGEDLITFMRNGLEKAEKVLIIGTPTYKAKIEKKSCGTKFEDQVITIDLYNNMNSSKFIPVLRKGSFNDSFNKLICLRVGYDMSDDEKYETQLEKLAADLWNEPTNAAPILGAKPNFSHISQNSQQVVASTSNEFVTNVKKYLSDSNKQIEFTELIEEERDEAFKKILKYADYNHQTTESSFKYYLREHQGAIAKLMSVVLPIVRYGNLDQQKLLVDAMVKLCTKPFKAGEVSNVETKNNHLFASTFLYHAVGVAAIKYNRFDLIKLMIESKVPAPNIYDSNSALSLAYLAGTNRWDNHSLNSYFHSNWKYPYSQMVMDGIKSYYNNTFIDETGFKNCYYTWERMSSLLCNFYKCIPTFDSRDERCFTVGEFLIKKSDFVRNEENFYTDFFNQSKIQKDEWLPIKSGLFGGRYDEFEKVLKNSEEYYSDHNLY